jgi:hypothetical protein
MATTIILLSVIVFALALAGMAVGVILSNRRLKGSCGGMAGRQDGEGNLVCEMCMDPSPECTGEPDSQSISQEGT